MIKVRVINYTNDNFAKKKSIKVDKNSQITLLIYNCVKDKVLSNLYFESDGGLFSLLRYMTLNYHKVFRKGNLIPMILTLTYIFKIIILNNFQRALIIKYSSKY